MLANVCGIDGAALVSLLVRGGFWRCVAMILGVSGLPG
jgi:hypothetical protein